MLARALPARLSHEAHQCRRPDEQRGGNEEGDRDARGGDEDASERRPDEDPHALDRGRRDVRRRELLGLRARFGTRAAWAGRNAVPTTVPTIERMYTQRVAAHPRRSAGPSARAAQRAQDGRHHHAETRGRGLRAPRSAGTRGPQKPSARARSGRRHRPRPHRRHRPRSRSCRPRRDVEPARRAGGGVGSRSRTPGGRPSESRMSASIAISAAIWKIVGGVHVLSSTDSSIERKGIFVSDQDRVRPSEPEGDVEAHKKKGPRFAEQSRRAEGKSDDDVGTRSGPRDHANGIVLQRAGARRGLRAFVLPRPAGPRRAPPAGGAPQRAALPGAGPGGRRRGRALRAPPSLPAPPARGAPSRGSSPIAAWFAKRPSSSISASVNRTSSERSRTERRPVLRPRGAAARPSGVGTSPVDSAASRPNRGSPSTSSTTRGWRVVEHPPAIPVPAGKRRPTSSSEPWPATASKTSSTAASSSRKIEDALAEKIARAVSTIDGGARVQSLARQDAGRDGRTELVVAHDPASTLFAVSASTLLSWNGARPGCFDRINAQDPTRAGSRSCCRCSATWCPRARRRPPRAPAEELDRRIGVIVVDERVVAS